MPGAKFDLVLEQFLKQFSRSAIQNQKSKIQNRQRLDVRRCSASPTKLPQRTPAVTPQCRNAHEVVVHMPGGHELMADNLRTLP